MRKLAAFGVTGVTDASVTNDAAQARLFAMPQGGHGAERSIGRRQGVANRDPHARGRTIGVANDVPPAAHGLAYSAVAGPLRIGARLAIAGHPHDDEAQIVRAQSLGAQVPAFQRARPHAASSATLSRLTAISVMKLLR